MQVPVPGLRHEQTQQCRHYTAQRRQHAAVVTSIKATGQRFSAYNVELTDVEVFPYLGRVLSKYDDNAPAVQTRLKKARASWARLGKVLRAENVSPRVSAMFYRATVQAVLLSGSETWTVTPHLMVSLEGFHVCAARRITGLMPKKLRSGQWIYPKTEAVLKAVGLHTIETYIGKRRHTVAKYITGRPVYDMVTSAKRLTGTPPRLLWTEQNLELPEVYETSLPSSPRYFDNAAVVRGRAHSAPQRRDRTRPDPRLRYMDAPDGVMDAPDGATL